MSSFNKLDFKLLQFYWELLMKISNIYLFIKDNCQTSGYINFIFPYFNDEDITCNTINRSYYFVKEDKMW